MNRCLKCGEHLILDEQSNSYYCERCNIIYDPEELMKPEQAKILFGCWLMWIPVLNLFMLRFIKNKPKEEQLAYTNVALASIFSQCVFGLLLIILLYVSQTASLDNFLVEARRVAEGSVRRSDYERLLPEFPKKEFVTPDEYVEEEEIVTMFNESLLFVLDNCIISGDKVKELINAYPTYGYLLQTTSVRTKYNAMNYYINVGQYINGCEFDEVTSYSFVYASLSDYFTLNKRKTVGFEEIDNEMKTSYIYGSARFLVNVLRSEKGECVGLAFTELEE